MKYTVISFDELSRLDSSNVGIFRERLAKINTDNDAVLIDLASIESIDSSGLGAIIAVVNSTRGKVNLLFCGINENIRRVMDLTRCSAVLNLHPSVNDAIEMLQQKSREFKKAA